MDSFVPVCKRCKDHPGCDRGKRLLLEDPPRREGQASYSYQRVIRFGLSQAQENWRRRTGRRLKKGGCPPPLVRVVPTKERKER